MATTIAVLDACVLFPASLRDTLLRAMQRKLYQGYWTDNIAEELRRNLISNHIMNDQQALKLLTAMATAFPEAEVADYQQHIPLMTNHPKDRHVLAAAVAVQAPMIVTFNLKDFPNSALAQFHVTAIAPDDFLLFLDTTYPASLREIIREQAKNLRHPPMSAYDVLSTLSIHTPRFAEQMRIQLQL